MATNLSSALSAIAVSDATPPPMEWPVTTRRRLLLLFPSSSSFWNASSSSGNARSRRVSTARARPLHFICYKEDTHI